MDGGGDGDRGALVPLAVGRVRAFVEGGAGRVRQEAVSGSPGSRRTSDQRAGASTGGQAAQDSFIDSSSKAQGRISRVRASRAGLEAGRPGAAERSGVGVCVCAPERHARADAWRGLHGAERCGFPGDDSRAGGWTK